MRSYVLWATSKKTMSVEKQPSGVRDSHMHVSTALSGLATPLHQCDVLFWFSNTVYRPLSGGPVSQTVSHLEGIASYRMESSHKTFIPSPTTAVTWRERGLSFKGLYAIIQNGGLQHLQDKEPIELYVMSLIQWRERVYCKRRQFIVSTLQPLWADWQGRPRGFLSIAIVQFLCDLPQEKALVPI